MQEIWSAHAVAPRAERPFVTVSQRRSKLFGLDAPTKVQTEVQITELQSVIRVIRGEKGGEEGEESAA